MKKLLEGLLNIVKGLAISVWALIAIATTIILLCYNDYGFSEISNHSIFVIDNDRLEPTFKEHDLVITKKVAENQYKVGDKAFFYLDNPADAVFINYGEITKIDVLDHAQDGFYFGSDLVSYDRIMGPANGAIVYHWAGLILSIFASKIGFIFLVILPTIFAIVYEIYAIIEEVKSNK